MRGINRLFEWVRPHGPDDETRHAIRRSEEIRQRVEGQQVEARWHSAYARRVIAENHLAPKIRAAIQESR